MKNIFNIKKIAAKKKKRKYKDERQEGDKIDWQLDFGHPENRRKDPYKPNKEAQIEKDFVNKDEKAIFIIANYFVENMNNIHNVIAEMSMIGWVRSPRKEYSKEMADDFFKNFERIKNIFNSLSRGALDYFFHDSSKETDGQASYIVENEMKKLEKRVLISKEMYDRENYELASKTLNQGTVFSFQVIGNRMDKNYLTPSGRQKGVEVQEFSQGDADDNPKIKNVSPNDNPSWGHGWKIEDEQGNWVWWKTHWDSSD